MIDFKNKKTLALLATLATVTIITILAAVYYFMSSAFNVVMVDFTTKTLQDVNTWATENELVEDQIIFEYEYDETIEKDIILSQDIKAEEKLEKDTVITFTVSKGFDPDLEVELISFEGQEEEFIKLWFEDNKFSDVTFELAADNKIKSGLFIEMNIETQTAKRSDVIVIKMSVGEKSVGIPIVIPDFSDYTIKNIQAWATTNNMSLTLTRQFSDKIKKDGVIAQSIKAGEASETGSKITVTVSNGEAVVVKDFKGMKEADIKKWGTDNNVKVTFDREYHKTILTNVFIESKPKASTKVIEGSTIEVLISEGKIDVKDFTGKTYAEFEKWLTEVNKEHSSSAKLKVAYGSTKPNSTDIIATQAPNKSVISPEGTITITIKASTKYEVKSQSNITFDEFKKYVTDKKMSVGNKDGDKYHDTIASGKIISSDAGSFAANTKIDYILSKGQYSFIESDYNDKSESQVNAKIKEYNNSGANIKASFSNVDSATVAVGKTFGCSYSNKTVSCKVSTGKLVALPNFVGNKKPINSDSGNYTIDGVTITIKQVYVDSDSEKDTVVSQNVAAGTKVGAGKVITLNISKGKVITTKVVPDYTDIKNYAWKDYDEAVSRISDSFTSAGFTNLSFIALDNDVSNPENRKGIILSVGAEIGATLEANTLIEIKIYKGY